MPSLDFINDISDTLKSQEIEYVIVAVQRKKGKESRLDFFHSFEGKEGAEALQFGVKKFSTELAEYIKNEKE